MDWAMPFSGPPLYRKLRLDDSEEHVLVEDFWWRCPFDVERREHDPESDIVTSEGRIVFFRARQGSVTDFASFPHWLPFTTTVLRDPHRVSPAAIPHDVAYRHHHRFFRPISRKAVDRMFLDILLELGVAVWRAKLMYRGVRAGGWRPWNRTMKTSE